jgi:hypothetical protein
MLVSFSVQDQNLSHLEEGNLKRDSPAIYKGLDAITSSLSQIGGTIGKSLEVSFDIIFFADVYIYLSCGQMEYLSYLYLRFFT